MSLTPIVSYISSPLPIKEKNAYNFSLNREQRHYIEFVGQQISSSLDFADVVFLGYSDAQQDAYRLWKKVNYGEISDVPLKKIIVSIYTKTVIIVNLLIKKNAPELIAKEEENQLQVKAAAKKFALNGVYLTKRQSNFLLFALAEINKSDETKPSNESFINRRLEKLCKKVAETKY
ncbi:hypothetical protein BN1013_02166 [Candidatus Rubidus massiliensis]|nr:hypothetical protein BN1013_02166 [Candidatus Rubidus massiliensis]